MGLIEIIKASFGELFKKSDKPVLATPKNKFSITKIENMTDAEKTILRDQYQSLKKDLEQASQDFYAKTKKEAEISNSKCPKCKSLNVNNRIKRIQGSINGTSSGNGSSSLFGGSSYSSGAINGKIDTNPVNKCNDCQHEWEIEIGHHYAIPLEDIAHDVCRFLRSCYEAYEKVTFNPNDLNEKFSSLEEKKQSLINNLGKSWTAESVKRHFSKYSIELIQYVVDSEVSGTKFRTWYYEDWLKSDKSLLTTILGIPSMIKS
jgi:hypothetical protein